MSYIGFRNNRPAIPGTEIKFPGSSERMVGRNGEFNANNKKDLMKTINMMVEAAISGAVNPSADARQSSIDKHKEAVASLNAVTAAFKDRANGKWETIGSEIAMSVSEVGERAGFARNLLMRVESPMGQHPKARVRRKQVTAVLMVGPSQTRPQYVRDDYVWMPGFDITAHVWVAENDLFLGTTDILDEKFVETQEAISVAEDRYWKQLADEASTINYNLQYLTGGLSLSAISAVRRIMGEQTMAPVNILMSLSYWSDIMENFAPSFDPVHQYELFSTGELGSIMGLSFITDGFRHPNLKVLENDDLYFVAAPEFHGAYSDRGPIQSTEIDGRQQGVLARGWFMSEHFAAAILNPYSVIRAKRA